MGVINTDGLVVEYLNKKKTAWSVATLKTTEAFLNKYADEVSKGSPQSYFEMLKAAGKAAYTIQTYFIHASNFYTYLYPTVLNPFQTFRKENRNAFKEAYVPKAVQVSYEEVKAILEGQEDGEEKSACLYLLGSAQRSAEAGLVRRSGELHLANPTADLITGKGGKLRPNFGTGAAPTGVSYYHVYHYIKNLCGISPHALRKLALTRAGRNGARIEDLCEIAGWSTAKTAIIYLQPQNTDRLKKYLE